MSRFGCGRELPITGVTRELDKPEYANLGPGHYKSKDAWIKKGNGLCFGNPLDDRFAPSSSMVTSETAKMKHLGPGQYWTLEKPPCTISKALQPSHEFGGKGDRFVYGDGSSFKGDLLDPEALTRDNWCHGPVILDPGVARKSVKAPFMNHSYKAPASPPPRPESAPPSPFATGPMSPSSLRVPFNSQKRPSASLLVPRAPAARPMSSTRRARGTGPSYAMLQAGLERKRAARGMDASKGAKWCSARPAGEATTRPQSALNKSSGAEARARAQLSQRPARSRPQSARPAGR